MHAAKKSFHIIFARSKHSLTSYRNKELQMELYEKFSQGCAKSFAKKLWQCPWNFFSASTVNLEVFMNHLH